MGRKSLARTGTDRNKMEKTNLVLMFKMAGDPCLQVKEASRIKIDGRGTLKLYGAPNGKVEEIRVRQLQVFQIRSTAAVETPLAVA